MTGKCKWDRHWPRENLCYDPSLGRSIVYLSTRVILDKMFSPNVLIHGNIGIRLRLEWLRDLEVIGEAYDD